MMYPIFNVIYPPNLFLPANEGNRNDLKLLRNFKRTKKKNNTKNLNPHRRRQKNACS